MERGRWRIARFLALAFFYTFLYLPIVVLIIYSFNKALFPASWAGATLHWYKSLYGRTDLWRALYNSLLIAGSSVVVTLLFCTACTAYTFFYQRLKWLPYALYVTIFVPEIVLAIALLFFFIFTAYPLGLTTLIISHSVMGVGYAFPLIYQRWSEIDRRLIEASYDLGATKLQTFVTIVLPLLRPALMSASFLVFILSFDDFLLAYFCGNSEIQTLPLALLSILRIGIAPEFNALATLMFFSSAVGILMYYSVSILKKNNTELSIDTMETEK